MDNKGMLEHFKKLSLNQQKNVVKEMQSVVFKNDYDNILKMRGDALDERRSECPHCDSAHYSNVGIDKGSRRYRCRNCKRSFTEYTGTWLSGIRRKELIPEFLRTMEIQMSLKKTAKHLGISESTAFMWRHRLLSSVEQMEKQPFKGITESDETFYLHSQKGKKCEHRAPRRRGGGHIRGVTSEYASLLTVMDREEQRLFKFTNM